MQSMKVKVLGLAAVAAVLMCAVPVERAQAVSLINPEKYTSPRPRQAEGLCEGAGMVVGVSRTGCAEGPPADVLVRVEL